MGLSLQYPSLLAPTNLCLLGQMTVWQKGIANRTRELPCSATYTGWHTNSLDANPATPKTQNRLPPHFYQYGMCIKHCFSVPGSQCGSQCGSQWFVFNIGANGSWLLMHNDLKAVFGQIKIQTMSYENCGHTGRSSSSWIFLIILCCCCSDFCLTRTDFIEIKKKRTRRHLKGNKTEEEEERVREHEDMNVLLVVSVGQ